MKRYTSEKLLNEKLIGKSITEILFLRDEGSSAEDKSTPTGVNVAIILDDGNRLFIESTDAILTLQERD